MPSFVTRLKLGVNERGTPGSIAPLNGKRPPFFLTARSFDQAIEGANFNFLCVGLCPLGVSAVSNGCKYIHRRDTESAEVAQRISNRGTVKKKIALAKFQTIVIAITFANHF